MSGDVAVQPDASERQRIRESTATTLFVDAGAGTGKTTTLVSRLLQTVANPDPAQRVPIRNIAAITFTRKAAAELRERLRRRLEAVVRDPNGFDGASAQAALHDLDSAAVETLHAFAGRLLRWFPLEAGLPVGFAALEGPEEQVAFGEWWDSTFRTLLAEDALKPAWEMLLGFGLKEQKLKKLARRLHENWDRIEGAEPPAVPPHRWEECAGELRDLLVQCSDPTDKLAISIAAGLRSVADAMTFKDPLERYEKLVGIKFIRGSGGKTAAWPGGLEAAKAATRCANDEVRLLANAVIAEPLRLVVARLMEKVLAYADARREAGRLTFQDQLTLARRLLLHNEEARLLIHHRFLRLLIDEFQDTDPLQVDLVMLIAGGEPMRPFRWESSQVTDGRLFFVGDPKQSIYRFRRAEIRLYQAVNVWTARPPVSLESNFRSRAEIIDYVNEVFESAFREEGQVAFKPLACGQPVGEFPTTAVQIVESTVDGGAEEAMQEEGALVARSIAEAVHGGALVRASEGTPRAVRLSDIAILYLARTHLGSLKEALQALSIPYRVESKEAAFETEPVQDLLSILGAVSDPTDEVLVVASLRTPYLACSDRDLLNHRMAGGLWNALTSKSAGDATVLRAFELLAGWHEQAPTLPVAKLLDQIIEDTHVLEKLQANPRPREDWNIVRFLQDFARDYDRQKAGPLRGFLTACREMADYEATFDEAGSPEADDDAVRLLTIHAAKGLEFPVVMLFGLSSGGSNQVQNPCWTSEGILALNVGKKDRPAMLGPYFEAQTEEKAAKGLEFSRLWYVAATRAKDVLVVPIVDQGKANQWLDHWRVSGYEATVLGESSELPLPAESAAPPLVENYEQLKVDRERLIKADRGQRAFAATALAQTLSEARNETDLPRDMDAYEPDDGNLAEDANESGAPEETQTQRRAAGSHFGRAVHAALQSLDTGTEEQIGRIARAQAAAEGVSDQESKIAEYVRRAVLATEAEPSRRWREVFISAQLEGVLLEGYIDLLVETGPNRYRIIDYKTDARLDPDGLERAMRRYRYQAAVYALAARATLRAEEVECVFLFLASDPPIRRVVSDLATAEAEVLTFLATV